MDSVAGAWAAIEGTEFVNSARCRAYLLEGYGPPNLRVEGDCDCPEGQLRILVGCDDAPWSTPAADFAPWYDAAIPESADFAGFFPTAFEGLESTYTREVTDTLNGGVLGRLRPAPRTMTWRGYLFGRTCCSVAYGLRWLTSVLRQARCGTECGGEKLDILVCCPPTGEEPTDCGCGAGIITPSLDSTLEFRAVTGGSLSGDSGGLTFTIPGAIEVGDLMLVSIAGYVYPLGPTPAGWTLLREDLAEVVPNYVAQNTYWKIAESSDTGGAATVNFDFQAGRIAGILLAYSGVDQTNPINTHDAELSTVAGTDLVAPSVTTDQANCRIVEFYAAVNAFSFPNPLDAIPATSRGEYRPDGQVVIGGADQGQVDPGPTGDVHATAANAGAWTGITIALNPVISSSADDAFRTLYNVGLSEGPLVRSQRAASGRCGCSTIMEIEFTLVAGNPHFYRAPVLLADGETFDVGNCPDWQVVTDPADCVVSPGIPTDCPDTTAAVTTDPNCPTPTLPPVFTVDESCFCDPFAPTSICVNVPASTFGFDFQGAPVFSIYSGSDALRATTIRLIENPLSSDCDDLGTDPCNFCEFITIRYFPAFSTLTIDGVNRRVTIETPGGDIQSGEQFMVGNYTWPLLECIDYCVCATVDGVTAAADATFSLSVYPLEM